MLGLRVPAPTLSTNRIVRLWNIKGWESRHGDAADWNRVLHWMLEGDQQFDSVVTCRLRSFNPSS